MSQPTSRSPHEHAPDRRVDPNKLMCFTCGCNQKVTGIIEPRPTAPDPTVAYVLRCGHITI